MSAQPVHMEEPEDPKAILRGLPERERGEFLRQYQAAVEAARDDVAQYPALRLLLRRWHLVVVAANQPGYYEAIRAAKAGVGRYTQLEDALADERARRAS
ncbi:MULTISPECIES: DUF6247 family protein [Sphaerimonospora]|uniref:Uncharacterized protein n=2 Tax=Sphaerimonospora TaxID=1792303 RepID=A0A8J3W173_9ACTN|nr:DUF6247 family protein [Sphaerimonospora thailandensis]GIH73024.1 hypothetical protein Mth01_52770 [Sphaerimonospora thailandensis]